MRLPESAIGWLGAELDREMNNPTGCPATCLEHDQFYSMLTNIAMRNASFEEEIISHMVALKEVERREKKARDLRAHIIMDKLAVIEDKIGHVANGGMKEAMMEMAPIMAKHFSAITTEEVKGKWGARVTMISGVCAMLGGVTVWLMTKFLSS